MSKASLWQDCAISSKAPIGDRIFSAQNHQELTCGQDSSRFGAFHKFIGLDHQRPNLVIAHVGMETDAYPEFLIAVIGWPHRLIALFQLHNVAGIAFHGNRRKVVDVEIAEHVPANIEHQNGELSPGEALEWRALGHTGQAEAEISEFFMLMILVRLGGRIKDRDRSWGKGLSTWATSRNTARKAPSLKWKKGDLTHQNNLFWRVTAGDTYGTSVTLCNKLAFR